MNVCHIVLIFLKSIAMFAFQISFFFFFWRGNDSRLYYLRNMIYNGKEREGHVTLSFSFATLAYVKVARLHRKEKKKRTKKKLQNPNYCKKSESSLGCPENQKKCQTTPS